MSDPGSDNPEAPPGPVIRDRRRLDPETGQLRDAYDTDPAPTSQPVPADQQPVPSEDDQVVIDPVGPDGPDGPGTTPVTGQQPDGNNTEVSLDGILADLDKAQASAAERLSDLQRLQAEFVNYRRRVDRDRDVARDTAVSGILEALLPVLDDVHLARQHGDLDGGPFAAIADKLDGVLQRYGLSRYGEQGEEFDPAVHEALMRTEAELPEGTLVTTVVQVLQPGYRSGDRVLRAARVAVADPH